MCCFFWRNNLTWNCSFYYDKVPIKILK
jgi:hypothetical protein